MLICLNIMLPSNAQHSSYIKQPRRAAFLLQQSPESAVEKGRGMCREERVV